MEGFRFSTSVRVRYAEIDVQNVVFNAHYMTYLDIGISDYYRKGLQLDPRELAKQGVFEFVLASCTLDFKQSATLDDVLHIWCRTVDIGRSSMKTEFAIVRDSETEPLLTATFIYVSIDPKTKRSQPVPTLVRERIEQYEGRTFSKPS